MIDGITAGTTSYVMTVMAYDSTSTVGAGKTGITYNGGITCYYKRSNGAASVSCTINTISTLGTYAGSATNAAWKEVDSTNMAGVYELQIPNNAFASGATDVMVALQLSGMVPISLYFRINPPADIQTALGTAITCTTGGIPDVNTKNIGNAAVSATTAQIGTNVVNWNNTVVATPATAGIPDINVKNMNNVAATAITAIKANIGQDQPLNFTGTAGSALVKVDVTDIATAAVATGTAQLGVNVVNMGGAALSAASAQVGVNVIQVGGTVQTAKDIGAAVPAAAAGASGGLLISGSNAGTTTLAALTVTGATTYTGNVSMAAGLTVTQSSGNADAVDITGNGTGAGLRITSGNGATGDAVDFVANSTNGTGLKSSGKGTGHGIDAESGTGATGDGIYAKSNATAGNGISGVHNGAGVYDLNATTTPLALAKTTNITGLNDIAATSIVSSGAITTSGGAVSTVTTLTNTVTLANGAHGGAAATLALGGAGGYTGAITGNLSGSVGSVSGNVTGSIGSIVAGAINNAAFNSDVYSTAYASNKLAQMMYVFFDNAFTGYSDGSTFTANGLLDRLTKLMWIMRNKAVVVDANGNTTIYKDDNSTSAFSVSGMLSDDSTNTTRLRVA